MRRRGEQFEDLNDPVVHRRFVRVIGLPEEEISASASASGSASASAAGEGERGAGAATGTGERDADADADADQHPGAAVRAIAAFNPGRRGVRAMAVVALAVLVMAGYLAWHSRPQSEPIPPQAIQMQSGQPQSGQLQSGQPQSGQPQSGQSSDQLVGIGAATASPVASAVLIIAVSGRVQHPGLVRLPIGSRVADAIEAAGGALPGTELSFINLARKLVDGELLMIGVTPPPGVAAGLAAAADPAAAGAAAGADPGGARPGVPVNLNTATLAQLQTLPGVGPVLAQRIVDHRTQHGAFRTVNDLRQVTGIGDTRFNQLKALVTV